MFYDRFEELCRNKGVKPSKAAIDAGINKSTVTYWKKTPDFKPNGAVIEKLSKYFGITRAELLGEQKERPLINNDEELTEYLEELRERSDMRMLFSVTKNATKEQVMAIVKMIEEMQGK